jgi:hypothetical protein
MRPKDLKTLVSKPDNAGWSFHRIGCVVFSQPKGSNKVPRLWSQQQELECKITFRAED